MPAVLLFSGPIGAGKTDLARAVAEGLGCACGGFSNEVRRVAAARGLGVDRATLADVGASLVREQPDQFCRAVLASAVWTPGQPIVIHGLRHLSILARMRAIVAPVPVRHVHVRVPPELRLERMHRRGESDFITFDAHSTEHDVISELPKVADLVVDGAAPVATNTARVLDWMRTDSVAPGS
jgi:dephospho-CoA kinase